MLELMIDLDRHEFWPDDLDCRSAQIIANRGIIGHRQVTDAYLLSLAMARDGKLATLDKRISQLFPKTRPTEPLLEVINTSENIE